MKIIMCMYEIIILMCVICINNDVIIIMNK